MGSPAVEMEHNEIFSGRFRNGVRWNTVTVAVARRLGMAEVGARARKDIVASHFRTPHASLR